MSADIPQLILVGVIVILTLVLIILGVQIYFILKESNETLKKVNKILDGASGIAGSAGLISNPIVKVVLGTALAFLTGRKKVKEIKEVREKRAYTPREKKTKRFFFRRG